MALKIWAWAFHVKSYDQVEQKFSEVSFQVRDRPQHWNQLILYENSESHCITEGGFNLSKICCHLKNYLVP